MHQGERYIRVLRRLHAVLKPRSYLEVGIRRGVSLQLATCPTIGIDPAFRLDAPALANKSACHLFRMTSDAFFAAHDPKVLVGGPLDLAFLDGMHLFEFLLRDFINTEAHCRAGSVVVLHDCLPTDVAMTRRAQRYTPEHGPTRAPGAWAGDVWKLVPILRRHRPDLKLLVLDAPPTGLVLISGLDPSSTVLRDRYDQIVAEYAALDLAAIGISAYAAEQDVQPTRSVATRADLARFLPI